MEYHITLAMLNEFVSTLQEEEKSQTTINKYVRDVKAFINYIGENEGVTKSQVIRYKQYLIQKYAAVSVNSMLAALNRFFKMNGWYNCIVRSIKIQNEAFRSQERELSREEYVRLLNTAKRKGKQRLYLLMETICATGIRVSELKFITTEAVCAGYARVSLKGKIRTILLPAKLCRKLKKYCKICRIKSGCVFITRHERPLDRSNILREMKALCKDAGVERTKVFPHNLRHLFAVTYYQIEKDLGHLADLLGHCNVNTTRIYTKISLKKQQKYVNSLRLIL
ncbi:MAG: tyrosine-type recombinase/integrase [Eubacteriales bacterium]|nr:tyrosine-type recombinase/integrase [Eubacteriales bacterium]